MTKAVTTELGQEEEVVNYWITAHWPNLASEPDVVDPNVWLQDQHREVGRDFAPGDMVLIYQSESGTPKVVTGVDGTRETLTLRRGRGGLVAVAKARARFLANGDESPAQYVDGRERWWRWKAELMLLSQSGFLPRRDLNQLLGYEQGYNWHAFGTMHSGLMKITEEQFQALLTRFRNSAPRARGQGHAGRRHDLDQAESPQHLALKEYVAAHPEQILREPGSRTIQMEFPFDSGDRADVVLEDSAGRVVGCEVELAVDLNDLAGILQAIKYRYMLELVMRREPGDSRALLVAYEISPEAAALCEMYHVECVVVPAQLVNAG